MSSDRKDKENADPGPYEAMPMEVSAARDNFADTLNRVSYKKERIVIRRHGKDGRGSLLRKAFAEEITRGRRRSGLSHPLSSCYVRGYVILVLY